MTMSVVKLLISDLLALVLVDWVLFKRIAYCSSKVFELLLATVVIVVCCNSMQYFPLSLVA